MSAALASLAADLDELAALGACDRGIDRRLFGPADRAARELFTRWARDLGCDVSQDAAGNVFARRGGSRAAPPILVGSHLDTVPGGGALDGAYGVVAALHVLRGLRDGEAALAHPIEAVAWAGEEASRFPLGCLGSSVFAGLTPLEQVEALRDPEGVSFVEARSAPDGLIPGVPLRAAAPAPVAYLELHIEQGPVLDARGLSIGIVSGIAGQVRLEIVVTGAAGHAGTVPMPLRTDALTASAELILALEALGRARNDAVVTVGRLVVEPNQANVIPGRVALRVDARSVDAVTLAALETEIAAACGTVAARRSVAIEAQPLERRAPAPMDVRLRELLERIVAEHGHVPFVLSSGAGHDAMCLAHVAPTAMLFVPSIGGRSHVADERTSPDDLDLGVRVLTRTVVETDRTLTQEDRS